MAYRFKLFRLCAIDVSVDSSWILCAGLVGWSLAETVFPTLSPGLSPALYWWMALVATLGFFASIVAHEFAHSLVARRFGISVRAITLFVFGGMAEMEHEPRTAKSELYTAAAGPAASLALACLFFLGETAAVAAEAPDTVSTTLWYLAMANAVLFLFNLIPAFPLDGGRVLRAALWAWRGDLIWATSIAAGAGSLFGFFLMAVGILDLVNGDLPIGVWNLMIGLFLRGAALAGREEAIMHTLLAGLRVEEVMSRSPVWVSPELSIETLVEKIIYRHPHLSFPVCRQDRLVGVIGLSRLSLVAPADRGATLVEEVMTPPAEAEMVSPAAEVLSVLRQLRQAKGGALWVVEAGRLAGVLTASDLQHCLAARRALDRRHRLSRSGFSAFP